MSDSHADLLADVAGCASIGGLETTAAIRAWLKQSADDVVATRRLWSGPRDTVRRRKLIDRRIEENFAHCLAVARAILADAGE